MLSEPVTFIMEQKMLRPIRDRVEMTYAGHTRWPGTHTPGSRSDGPWAKDVFLG